MNGVAATWTEKAAERAAGRLRAIGRERAFGLARRGTLALIDEGLSSTSNFIISLLLARWLAPADYGLYALMYYTVATGFVALANALWIGPMAVLGPARHAGRLAAYLRAVQRLQGLALAAIALATAAAGGALAVLAPGRWPGLSGALAGLALGVSGFVFMQFRRRCCYILGTPASAVWRAALYGAVLLGGTAALRRLGLLDVGAVLALVGGAGFLAGLPPIRGRCAGTMTATAAGTLSGTGPGTLSGTLSGTAAGERFGAGRAAPWGLRQTAAELWNYGRWMGGSALVDWVRQNIAYLASAGLLGLAGTGMLQAAFNLAKPFPHLLTAFNYLALPRWAARAGRGGTRAVAGMTFGWAAAFAALGLGYAAVAGLAAPLVFTHGYRGQYDFDAVFVGLILVTLAVNAASAVIGMGLNAALRPQAVLWSQVVGVTGGSLLGLPLTMAFGLRGVAAWALLAALVQAAFGGVLLARAGRGRPGLGGAAPGGSPVETPTGAAAGGAERGRWMP